MRTFLVFLCSLTFILIGCSSEENTDQASEIACSAAKGVWVISGATCDGAAVTATDYENIAIDFTSSTSAVQSQGPSACVSQINWAVAHGDFNNTLDLTASGNLACLSGGASVSNCTDGASVCSDSQSVDGFQNNFETCAISSGTMSLRRAVSSTNNPNDLSFCSDGQSEVVTLSQATTSTLAELDINGSDPADFGAVSNGSSSNLTLTMVNSGQSAATGLSVSGLAAPFNFLGGLYPGTGGDCGASLAAGASCSMVVQFSPVSSGAVSDALEIDYNNGSAAAQFTHGVTGSGFSGSLANLTISGADPVDFGAVTTGATSSLVFTVTNTGTAVATGISESGLSTPFRFTSGTYPGTAGTCVTTLNPGNSCNLEVEFAPVVAGLVNSTLTLNYNNGVASASAQRQVQGSGVAPGLLVISDGPSFAYPSIATGSSSSHIFTVSNVGGSVATSIFSPAIPGPFRFSGAGSYPGISGTCFSVLAPGANCTMEVEFAPIAAGPFMETIVLQYNDGAALQSAQRLVTGNGL